MRNALRAPSLLAAACLIGVSGFAAAAPTVVTAPPDTFSIDLSGFPPQAPTVPTNSNALSLRNQFITGSLDAGPALLAGYVVESFETNSNGNGAGSLNNLFGVGASVKDNTQGTVRNDFIDSSSQFTGRWNTTGGCALGKCNWWDTSDSFVIDFNGNYSAFGFYGTDFADFDGTVELSLLEKNTNGVLVSTGDALTVASPGSSTLNGNLLFFGLKDTSRSYAGVQLRITQGTGTDYFGFDDMILGNVARVTPPVDLPEPTSLALVGLALAGLAASRRKRA